MNECWLFDLLKTEEIDWLRMRDRHKDDVQTDGLIFEYKMHRTESVIKQRVEQMLAGRVSDIRYFGKKYWMN